MKQYDCKLKLRKAMHVENMNEQQVSFSEPQKSVSNPITLLVHGALARGEKRSGENVSWKKRRKGGIS